MAEEANAIFDKLFLPPPRQSISFTNVITKCLLKNGVAVARVAFLSVDVKLLPLNLSNLNNTLSYL